MLIARTAGISALVQEAVPTPIPSSAQRPLHVADRLGLAGQPGAQEPRGCGGLALPEAHVGG